MCCDCVFYFFYIIFQQKIKWVDNTFNLRITEYEALERLSRDVQNQIVLRNKEPKLSEAYGKLSATIRNRLKQFSKELNQLSSTIKNKNMYINKTFIASFKVPHYIFIVTERLKKPNVDNVKLKVYKQT